MKNNFWMGLGLGILVSYMYVQYKIQQAEQQNPLGYDLATLLGLNPFQSSNPNASGNPSTGTGGWSSEINGIYRLFKRPSY